MVIKKILGAGALALAVMLAAGCASTPTGSAAYKQAVEEGLPQWVQMGGFWTEENKNGDIWKGPVVANGYFQTGNANHSDARISTKAAELDGRSELARTVKDGILVKAKAKLAANEFDELQESMTAVTISGIRRVDRFIAKDGTVYVLMFVPSENLDKAMKEVIDAKYYALVDAILYMSENE